MKLCCSRAAWYSAFSRQIAVRARLGDRLDDVRPRLALQLLQLLSQPLGAAQRHGVRFTPQFLVQILQSIDFDVAQMIERIAGGARAGHCRVVGHPSRHRLAADGARLAHRLLAFGGIDDQRDLVIFYHIDDVRATLPNLIDASADDTGLLEDLRRAAGGRDLEAARDQHLRQLHCTGLVAVAHAHEAQAARRQDHPRGGLRLGVGLAEGVTRCP